MKTKLYFTSDWHIGHTNVIKFDNRPFKDVDEMAKVLIKNFNMLVPTHGITYFLGDMGLCANGLLKTVIDQLHGTKILVRGNHDGKMDAMYEVGFDMVTEKAQITIGDSIVTMTHCPLKGLFREDTTGMSGADGTDNWHGEWKHKNRFSIEDFGQFHLHGHIHSPNKGKSQRILGRQMDIGVTANKYKPVPIADIISWINKTKEEENKKNQSYGGKV